MQKKNVFILTVLFLCTIAATYLYGQTVVVGNPGGRVDTPILFPDGTAAAPSISFSSEPGLGWYKSGNGVMTFVGGVISGANNAIPDNMLSTNVPLLNAANVFSGAGQLQNIQGAVPEIRFRDTDMPLDQKVYSIDGNFGTLRFVTYNDDGTGGVSRVSFSRSGSMTAGKVPASRLRNNADTGDIFDASDNMIEVGNITQNAVIFASLPASTNGTQIYCSDCTFANPCASGGTGAFAKRLNGAWRCD